MWLDEGVKTKKFDVEKCRAAYDRLLQNPEARRYKLRRALKRLQEAEKERSEEKPIESSKSS